MLPPDLRKALDAAFTNWVDEITRASYYEGKQCGIDEVASKALKFKKENIRLRQEIRELKKEKIRNGTTK